MPAIRILNDRLVGQIAAGEVVERPASVVKELVENALDAGASSVAIELEWGGKRRIRVIDDGWGMDRDDTLLAFDRHATSKIESMEDLERVATLGFRGEALASIAAVARVTLSSARQSGEGHMVRLEGGRVRATEPVSHPRGTVVEVASLFFNVPARRKFLKSTRTELRRCVEVVQGYALARPDVGFSLGHDGRSLLDAAPAGEDLEAAKRRIGALFGGGLVDSLVAIPSDPARGSETIAGFVGGPDTVRGRRYFTFVNRRLIRDRALMSAFYRAVREEWRRDEFPALFLFLELPAEEVDVNVHPQKSEVRFRNPAMLDRVRLCLGQALRRGLGEEGAALEPAEGGRGTPFVWQGLGGRPAASAGTRGWPMAAEVWEGRPAAGAPGEPAGRLAEAVYAPLERAPVALSGRDGESRPFRLLGQYKGTLILLEGPDGLYLIDQHVAHERVLFERFESQLRRDHPPSQVLLEPVLLELSAAEALRLGELIPELERCGFSLSELSGGSMALSSVPQALSGKQAEALLLRLAAEDGEGGSGPEELRSRLLAALAASRSCRAAVKMHDRLSAAEMEVLVDELFSAEQPFVCPHGRPVVLKMTDLDLEKRFGRR